MCQICGQLSHVWNEGTATNFSPTSTTKPVATLNQAIYQLTTQWPSQEGYSRTWTGTSALTYSIPSTAPGAGSTEASGFKAMTPLMQAAAREAFELWDDVIAISLNESTSPTAQITFAYSTKTSGGGTYAQTFNTIGMGTTLSLTAARVWIAANNAAYDTDADLGYGGYARLTYVHEIGHALGLSHPGTYNAGSGGSITYAGSAEYAQDTRQYTVMSYFNAGSDGAAIDHVGSDGRFSYAAAPLLHDIAAAQAKYGADTTTRTGNTTYGFNANAGRAVFDFTQNKNPVIAIWDAGGVDTLDFSGFTTNQKIYLAAGAFSDVGSMTKNLAIAFGAVVENAVGGSGSDLIEGNAAANLLKGGAGNDTLKGHDGADTLDGGSGADSLTGGAGADVFLVGAASGADTVADFQDGVDLIRFSGVAAVTGFASLTLTAASGGVRVTWGGADSLFLTGVGSAQLSAADFGWTTGSTPAPAPAPAPAPTVTGVTVTGTSSSERLYGGAGGDTLNGMLGNDALFGGAGADRLDGGGGFDDAAYTDATSSVTVNLATGAHGGLAQGDVFVGIERWTLSAHADSFIGDAGNQHVHGGAGNDVLDGKDGQDTLFGDAGRDVLTGGGGYDTLYGGAEGDTFVFGAGSRADRVQDFQDGLDLIRIVGVSGVDDFSDLRMTQRSDGVLVTWASGVDSVLLAGLTTAKLSSADFLFA